jgi:pyruvate,water dikinase
VAAYSEARGFGTAHEVAVIVQLLVRAVSSGVLFTTNPITGRRDEAVINAAWGLGESVVGGRVTPDLLTIDKVTRRVVTRQTADKAVMTVLAEGGTAEQPVPVRQRRAPVLSDAEAAELVRLGTGIEALYGRPMDIEWAQVAEKGAAGRNGRQGAQFRIVQARPITALPDAAEPRVSEPEPPREWELPDGSYVAMRNNIVELMADPLTPLFGTLGLGAVNASMERLVNGFFGRPGLLEEPIVTVNQYAYYDGSFTPGQLLKILIASPGIPKRMFSGAVERWTETGRPRYAATVASWDARRWLEFPSGEILSAVRELTEAAIDAYGALVGGVIPAAWISEGLFTLVYNTLIKRRDDPTAATYLMGLDSVPIRAEKSLYDLATWVRGQGELAAYVLDAPAVELASDWDADCPSAGLEADAWQEWRRRVQAHLDEYGHTIYNLDFASPVPADDPAPLLETVKLFVAGEGTDPYVRQRSAAEARERATRGTLARLRGVRRRLFKRALATAQRYAPLREDGLADVGLSYPLIRRMLRELGRRFTVAGLVAEPDDVFWLRQEEVEQASGKLDRGEPLPSRVDAVPERKASWRAARRATPPRMLPQIKLFGRDLLALKSGPGGESLKGVAASPGTARGPARVVVGPDDFASMRAGEVLVAALTTPAWTPLFARAAAVVTDVGGPLSHGSIVAREYGIPAVLGTGDATKRIRNGQIVTVDGSAGLVSLGAG